jgi:hypothetical protein
MTDEPGKPASPKILPIIADFPGPDFPMLYADSVSSIQPGVQTTKFYLARFEPHMRADNTLLTQPFVQIVMPTGSFVDTAAFFVRMVRQLIETKAIDQEAWDKAQASYDALKNKVPGGGDGV